METFSALLAICVGKSPVPGEFPTPRPVTRCFDVFFDLRPDKRLSKQWWGWWFETLSRPLWRHCNITLQFCSLCQLMVWQHILYDVWGNARTGIAFGLERQLWRPWPAYHPVTCPPCLPIRTLLWGYHWWLWIFGEFRTSGALSTSLRLYHLFETYDEKVGLHMYDLVTKCGINGSILLTNLLPVYRVKTRFIFHKTLNSCTFIFHKILNSCYFVRKR